MAAPGLLEIVLLLALSGASLYLFWLRFGKVVRIIRAARPDPSFKLEPISNRIGKFVWEVLLQGLVIRQRPLPGLAHAFVFWGFLAFALVTIDHLAAGFGVDLIPRESLFGRLYFGFVALFAAAVLVSIAGLAARRFFVRPVWLGKLSPESGIIALLIATLMVTYLVAYRIGDEGTLGHVNWWVHTAALLIFLPLIPKTKHLHLILSPATVFLERPGFSAIPPLAGDEDFGLDTGKDVTRIDALQAFSCVECGRCTEHCPAYNTGKELNPKTVILGLRGYLRDEGPAGEAPLLGLHISQKAVFQCTTCGACEYQCPVGIQHLPVMIGLRRGAVNTGKWEDDYGNKLFLALERNGNALGMASAERDKFIAKNELPVFDGTQEYCLCLGCMGSYDPRGREIILSLVSVLKHLGVTFGVLKKERCTGDPARRLGNDLAFGQLVEQNAETIKASKATKFLSICPHCVRTMSEDWKELNEAVTIEHHSEFLARHEERLPSGSIDGKVVFHDPCYLGRYRGVYEEPRRVIARSAEVIDPPRARERSFCCGAGGGLAFLGEEEGKRVSAERAEQLASTGAAVVGAACPFCNTMFRDALAAIPGQPPRLLDIAQIAAASLIPPSKEP
jgi:Fe-S oxidoreductase